MVVRLSGEFNQPAARDRGGRAGERLNIGSIRDLSELNTASAGKGITNGEDQRLGLSIVGADCLNRHFARSRNITVQPRPNRAADFRPCSHHTARHDPSS